MGGAFSPAVVVVENSEQRPSIATREAGVKALNFKRSRGRDAT